MFLFKQRRFTALDNQQAEFQTSHHKRAGILTLPSRFKIYLHMVLIMHSTFQQLSYDSQITNREIKKKRKTKINKTNFCLLSL